MFLDRFATKRVVHSSKLSNRRLSLNRTIKLGILALAKHGGVQLISSLKSDEDAGKQESQI
jgi:hypothetical protein